MPDISKCPGGNCNTRFTCWRFTSLPSPHWQTYFVNLPTEYPCPFYWNDAEYSEDRKIPVDQRSPFKEAT
jgi:hypothetical protein